MTTTPYHTPQERKLINAAWRLLDRSDLTSSLRAVLDQATSLERRDHGGPPTTCRALVLRAFLAGYNAPDTATLHHNGHLPRSGLVLAQVAGMAARQACLTFRLGTITALGLASDAQEQAMRRHVTTASTAIGDALRPKAD